MRGNGFIKKSAKVLAIKLGLKKSLKSWREELVKRGLNIGDNVLLSAGVIIDENYPYLVSIGDNCKIASGVRILTHDSTLFDYNGGYMKIARVDIKENCIIGVNSIILPGVTIGPNVLVAAGSVVNKDIPPNTCVAGNPARFYSKFDILVENMKKDIHIRPKLKSLDYIDQNTETSNRKKVLRLATKEGNAYIDSVESRNTAALDIKNIK